MVHHWSQPFYYNTLCPSSVYQPSTMEGSYANGREQDMKDVNNTSEDIRDDEASVISERTTTRKSTTCKESATREQHLINLSEWYRLPELEHCPPKVTCNLFMLHLLRAGFPPSQDLMHINQFRNMAMSTRYMPRSRGADFRISSIQPNNRKLF